MLFWRMKTEQEPELADCHVQNGHWNGDGGGGGSSSSSCCSGGGVVLCRQVIVRCVNDRRRSICIWVIIYVTCSVRCCMFTSVLCMHSRQSKLNQFSWVSSAFNQASAMWPALDSCWWLISSTVQQRLKRLAKQWQWSTQDFIFGL